MGTIFGPGARAGLCIGRGRWGNARASKKKSAGCTIKKLRLGQPEPRAEAPVVRVHMHTLAPAAPLALRLTPHPHTARTATGATSSSTGRSRVEICVDLPPPLHYLAMHTRCAYTE